MPLFVLAVLMTSICLLSGCNDTQESDTAPPVPSADIVNTDTVSTQPTDNRANPTESTLPKPNTANEIDWAAIDSQVVPIDPASFEYPFALDSQPVMNYAKLFGITPKQAQHSMMLAMASPEALVAVAEHISGHYVGHELQDGAKMTLVVYTDQQIIPSEHDFVFADDFARGLVIPVSVRQAK